MQAGSPAAAIAPASASYPAASAGNWRDRTLRPLQSRTHSQCESAWVSTPQKTGPRAPGVDSVLMSRSVLSVLAWTGQTAH